MSRWQSRAQREAAFVKLATDLHAQLEAWYDHHPAASFGEIEEAARRLRRAFMRSGLAVVINGRDTGFQLERACYACREYQAQTLFPPG